MWKSGVVKKGSSIKLKVKIKKLSDNAIVPKYTRSDDAGMDLTAISVNVTEAFVEYKTGISIELPRGHVGLVFPRSSISKKDLSMSNSVAVFDVGYTGEYIIRFQKLGENIYKVGERIAQLIILPYPKVEFEEVENLSDSERKSGAFGSSGN